MKPRRESQVLLLDLQPQVADFGRDVAAGLSASPKTLPSKYFYDDRGAELFERICELTEYYPTRTELTIMEEHVPAMASCIGSNALLVEFGSGTSMKTRYLLDMLKDLSGYVPTDISRGTLLESSRQLASDYPHHEILPVCADFSAGFDPPKPQRPVERTVVYFPGSTIGNFKPAECLELLSTMAEMTAGRGGLLIGVDLKKDPQVLHRAYNDARGITAAFNLNLLGRINRELGGTFELDCFRHYAFYNPVDGRIEMHLVSLRDQAVEVEGQPYEFSRGESTRTELSYKYDPKELARMAGTLGMELRGLWMDPRQQFSVQYFEVNPT